MGCALPVGDLLAQDIGQGQQLSRDASVDVERGHRLELRVGQPQATCQ